MTLRIAPDDLGSWPRTRTEPWDGDVRPHMMRISDDLPAPLGPSREVRPRPMLTFRPLRATTPPYHFATFLISITGGPQRDSARPASRLRPAPRRPPRRPSARWGR